jgi:hypothetical protein
MKIYILCIDLSQVELIGAFNFPEEASDLLSSIGTGGGLQVLFPVVWQSNVWNDAIVDLIY